MAAPIHFHTDLYRRDALRSTAASYHGRAVVDLQDSEDAVLARLEPLNGEQDPQTLRDEFSTEAFAATARRMRELAATDARDPKDGGATPSEIPPWPLLAPFTAGCQLGLGWVLESLGPVRGGAASLVLRHEGNDVARVTVRRNTGAPLGIAHTDQLDFLLMNGGGGSSRTDESVGRVLLALAAALRERSKTPVDDELLAALLPHTEMQAPAPAATNGADASAATSRRIAPHVDRDARIISFDFAEAGISRLALYDAVLRFAARCYLHLDRPAPGRIGLRVKPRGDVTPEAMRVLVHDVTLALNQIARRTAQPEGAAGGHQAGLAPLSRRNVDLEALLAELDAADAKTLGLGFQPERGPGHDNLRVLNVRGTGACNSECVFCIEKFNPTHRPMPKADATRQLIADSAGRFDMLFFASGEPTIHPKLFEYVELGRSVGFTGFGMSSHFRTFSDPRFALKTLQAGFEYFDIALHAADDDSQLEVNPIGDGGASLWEALKGLAILFRLADALGIRISVTQKIVISRLNVLQLESVFRATYDRGVRHFVLQPVRALGLAPELQQKLAISEEEMLPHLNELLGKTAGLGATIKPYGFSRQNLLSASHVEIEQNRVKNIYGKAKYRDPARTFPVTLQKRATDGRYWVEVRDRPDVRFGFPSDGSAPVLDDSIEHGAVLPFGCRMGSCGMCCARLLEGSVDQSSQIFLSEEQIEAGFVLLCQARPQSDIVVELCTEDEIDQL